MLLVSCLGCGLMAGMADGFLSLKNTLGDYIRDMKYPDAVIDTEVTTVDVLEELNSLPGVEAADARLTGNLIMVGSDGVYYSMQAMTYSEEEFQGVYYWEKSDREAEYPILLERRFAMQNNISAGDSVEIRVEDRSWDCLVRAVISRPEMIAHHKLGDITVVSTDIGYVYVPLELLEKVNDPEFEAASAEWDRFNEEYLRKKQDAEKEYEKVQGELTEAENTLSEKKDEFDSKLKEAESKKEELLQNREAVSRKTAELELKEQELLDKKKELEQSEEKLRSGEEELSSGRDELVRKKSELDKTAAELEKTRKDLEAQLADLQKQKEDLARKKQEALEGQKEIEQKLAELEEQEAQLISGKEELLRDLELLKLLRSLLEALEEYGRSLYDTVMLSEEAEAVYQWALNAVDAIDRLIPESERLAAVLHQIRDGAQAADLGLTLAEAAALGIAETAAQDKQIIDLLEALGITSDDIDGTIAALHSFTETMQSIRSMIVGALTVASDPEVLEALRQSLISECKEMLRHLFKDDHFPYSLFDWLFGLIDSYIRQAEDGLAQIEDGLSQITEGRKLLYEKQREVSDGLAQIAEGEQQIRDGEAALKAGLSQVEDGLSQVKSGYGEIDSYEKKLRDEESKLRSGREELDEYNRQIPDAEKAITEGRDSIRQAESDIASGLKEIDDAVSEGEQQLRRGEDELERNRSEAEEKWQEAQQKFKSAEDELSKAKTKLDEWKGYGDHCNQFMLRTEPGADPEAVLARAEELIGRDRIKKSCTYENSEVKHSIDVNVDPLEVMSLYVPLLFFAVALIADFLFMSFLIRQCRREIGILRALGYTRSSIVGLFCSVNALVSAGAIILGLLIGFGVTRFIGEFFRSFFCLHYFNYQIHWSRLLISIAVTFIVGQAATILSTGYVSRIHPSEAMSRPAPVSSHAREGGLLSRLHLPPFIKYCISTLLRNKKRLVFSVICLSSSVVLIFAAFSFYVSKNKILSEQFDDRIQYDCEIFFNAEPDPSFRERLAASGLVKETEAVCYYTKEIEAGGAREELTVKAIEAGSELIGIYGSDGSRLYASSEGLLLEKHTAELLGVSEGDKVSVGGVEMPVAGIPEEYENRSHYIAAASREALGTPVIWSVICTVDKADEIPLMEFLSREKDYVYAAFTSRLYDGIVDSFRAFGVCSLIVLIFAVVIGSVIVINTVCTNLQEQKKDLCVLRALGFQYSGISFRLLTQAGVYYFFACLIGIPGGIGVTKLILQKLEVEGRSYPFVNAPSVYLFTLLLVMVYVIVSHFISMRMIKKWDLAETVKDKE